MRDPAEQAAESAGVFYRRIKDLRKLGLPKREFEARSKALKDQWWQENRHLFTKGY